MSNKREATYHGLTPLEVHADEQAAGNERGGFPYGSDCAARVEAERRYGPTIGATCFVAGAAWQAAQPVVVTEDQIDAAVREGMFKARGESNVDLNYRERILTGAAAEGAVNWLLTVLGVVTVEPTP